eukprot:Ihof_evm24s10 gene=Ihof_evmTU24s10
MSSYLIKALNALPCSSPAILHRRGLMSSTMTTNGETENEVATKVIGSIGVATLNRPRALNTLTTNMCQLLTTAYSHWMADPTIKMVLLQGAGPKAFCAGGDVVSLAKAGSNGDTNQAKEFFSAEYKLDYLIATLPKPHIALLDGITMGGGMGLSVFGTFRVATEKTLFAMPETAIGLFPDVGGGYFLPRLANHLGMYLGLTGARLKGADALHAKIATHYILSNRLPDLIERLAYCQGDSNSIKELLDSFSEPPPAYTLSPHLPTIEKCFSNSTVEGIIESLQQEGPWGCDVAKTIGTMSPTSCKITLQQLRRGSHLSLAEDLKVEFRLACNAMKGHDFYEGIRARLI